MNVRKIKRRAMRRLYSDWQWSTYDIEHKRWYRLKLLSFRPDHLRSPFDGLPKT